jgi:hypothetical protein
MAMSTIVGRAGVYDMIAVRVLYFNAFVMQGFFITN